MEGMNNQILNINLSSQKISVDQLDDLILSNYLGGRGLGVKLFTDIIPKGIDPFSKENPLIFSIGPVTASTVPTSGRFSLVTKSPLTNTIFHSNSGGYWGPFFKRCGYDCLIVSGKSKIDDKSYIVIDGNDNIDIKDGTDLWGLKTSELVEKIREKEGKNSQVLCIGPAGENLVRISSIMNQGHRAFGRGGVGAVMGSKNLKAIVVKNGNKKFPIQDKEYMRKLNIVALDKIRVVPTTSQGLVMFGTSALVKVINLFGMFPVKNFQSAFTDSNTIDMVSGEKLREKYLVNSEGCYNCIIKCGRMTSTGEMSGKGPEYESLWALGPLTGIFNLKEITHANYLCNDYGLDTISTGGTIACAMEMRKNNIINNPDLEFGKHESLPNIIKTIALRDGIGDELAEGSLQFSKKYNSSKYAMQVKGMEIPAYDPRGAFGHALNYAVSSRGACHLTGFLAALEILGVPKLVDRFMINGKSDLLFLKQNQSAVEDSLVVCKFVGYALGFEFQARFLSTILHKEISSKDLITIGERIYNLERLYNFREGFSKEDDTLPSRFLEIPLTEGPSKGKVVPLNQLLKDYYHVRQWDNNGNPTEELLERLSIKRLV
ncbi:MAG: aldehyde ferredoxin oxidoreductase family protein [Candidatus Lokiarchaeota archaeon]|nr:aldehyde ferredoxin oxidoreductase family protein [Candidatus Lokiarchaeota archaeon]